MAFAFRQTASGEDSARQRSAHLIFRKELRMKTAPEESLPDERA